MKLPALCRNRLVCLLAMALALTGLLTLVWRHTALADVVTPENVVAWVDGMSEKWWIPLVILAAYTPAMVIMFPRPLITLAAVVAYGPWLGGLLAMTGIEIASTAGYFAGRLMKEDTLHRWAGPKFEHVADFLKKRGLFATFMVRVLPVAPFAVVSAVAGALRLKVWHLIAGTFLGMFPGMFGTTILSEQVAEALATGTVNWWLVAAGVLILASVAFFARRWLHRMERGTI
jgi:LPXTG-motif cell wall-anchored protein